MQPDTPGNVAHNQWVSTLGDAREKCRQAVARAEVQVSDHDRALWPTKTGSNMSNEQKVAAELHAHLLDFAEHVEPYQNECVKPWTEHLATHEFGDGDTLPICLDDIERWANRDYIETEWRQHELTGREKVTTRQRVYIPAQYGRELFRQINGCLENLGLAAQVERAGRSR
jgi:hypothetical protein